MGSGKEEAMETEVIIRVVAGVLFFVVLGVIVWRRKRQAAE